MKEEGLFYRNRRVLVTGGTGLVGSYVVRELLGRGALVRVPRHRRPPVVQDERVEYVDADLRREEDCLGLVQGIEFVFHAAGAVGSAAVTPAGSMDAIVTNLVLTANMLQAAWTGGAKRFVYFSSSTVYPAADHPVAEDEAWNGPTHPAYFGYGWMKRYLERLGEFAAAKSGMRVVIVRPTAVYGPHDDFDPATCHVIPALVRKAVERWDPYEVWGTGEEVRDFLHAADLARGSLLALEKGANCDPINIAYGKGVQIREVVRLILRAADHGEARVIFNADKPTAIPFRAVDISKARTLLGFEPEISLEAGLADTVAWFSKASPVAV